MNNHGPSLDLRSYRPAAVLVIDLVKHSTKPQEDVFSVQRIMEEALRNATTDLGIDDAYFNYTGDGYLCALAGDSSARALDFVNAAIPEMVRRFAPYDQQLRGGLDFGLVHLSRNPLTGKDEYFDTPSIVAARIEQAAQPGKILCTETVQKIFGHRYPGMFTKDPFLVQTKDRVLSVFEVIPFDIGTVSDYFSSYFVGPDLSTAISVGDRRKVLVVDDERLISEVISTLITAACPEIEIVRCQNGVEALKVLQPGEVALVLTDLVMPKMDGIKLTEHILAMDPDVIIAMITGYASSESESLASFFEAGGSFFIEKPFEKERLFDLLRMVFSRQFDKNIRNSLSVLCEEPGALMVCLHRSSLRFRSILADVSNANDTAHGLLRHKAKQIVNEFTAKIRPGIDITSLRTIAEAQLSCVSRLARAVSRLKTSEFISHIDNLVSDWRLVNPSIKFSFETNLEGKPELNLPHAGILVLVLVEIVDNAVSALNRSGEIRINMALLKTTGLLQITVQDSGPGIPAHLVPLMYEEGVSTKGTGRGLGLSLVRQAVLCLRGEIDYEYLNGAKFRITVPCEFF